MSDEKKLFDDEFKPQEDSGLTSLQAAYNSREVSLPMLIVGAAIVAALAGILVAIVLVSGAA
ncbi:MAG: hypothetical protein Q3963_04605 [Coriobacteriaceae bacterium]|nr:hypothetical protein [Coriobacteriaceae bacterium]